MVEGSKIDWAAHANDPIGLVADVLAFEEAVGVAKRYAEMHGDTLVISVTDHGNSGLTIGDASTSSGYDKLPLSVFVEPLRRATMTGEGIGQRLDAERTNIRQVMADGFGIEDLTDAEHEAIKKASLGSMNYVVGPMIASRAKIGFTTNGHTGEDVTLYVHDPAGSRA